MKNLIIVLALVFIAMPIYANNQENSESIYNELMNIYDQTIDRQNKLIEVYDETIGIQEEELTKLETEEKLQEAELEGLSRELTEWQEALETAEKEGEVAEKKFDDTLMFAKIVLILIGIVSIFGGFLFLRTWIKERKTKEVL